MEKDKKKKGVDSAKALIVSIVLFFMVLGAVVFSVSRRITQEMAASAIGNLSESLDLIRGTIETMLRMEAEYQKLMAQEIAESKDPEGFIRFYERNEIMTKVSVTEKGAEEGISSTGEAFRAQELDFSAGNTVDGLRISQSYLNDMGTWAYTMECPVAKDGEETKQLYVEYIYDSFDDALPDNFYNANATLYIMDVKSQRFVLKPKGMGERDAGHLNLEDFCHANRIVEEDIRAMITDSIAAGEHVMFYHNILGRESLIYMWPIGDGGMYLIGYVPVEAIQKEGSAVNQNIFIVVAVMLLTFFLCCLLFAFNERQKKKLRKERNEERELHNRQLAEALREAQIANNSKTTFLSNMSHDIRTPMNAILGFTRLLQENADYPVKVREYTRKIMVSGQHLLSLINDILDVSKIESGKVVLSLNEFTLSEMVASVDAIIRPAARAREQKFDVRVTGIRHEHLIGDETRINQILINLLSNAVKYTQEGGNIQLRMTGLDSRRETHERIRIEVEDDGFGMTPEYLEIIFDAFTRAENSTTNKVQGTGLGMAITKNIVELMGGTIEVSSEVGKGSLFTVELELLIAERAEDRFWKEHGITRILAVDDEEEICGSIRMLMEETKVRTDTAAGGAEGLLKIREQERLGEPYDLILVGLSMSGMSGIETVKKIREEPAEKLPVCLLCAHDWDGLEEEAFEAGADGFLAKPFFVSALKERLLTVFTARGLLEPEKTAGGGSGLEGRHFLVAEDNEINGEILQELLEIEGATCEIMANGKLAAEHFAACAPGSYDAVLMDVQMPVMNGYEATRKIRESCHEEAKTIPIVAMTANAFAEDVKEAMDAGMDAHVAKPIDMEALRRTLEQLLKERV
ncbi:MAG: response regulator [Lachnospiraceae bacterium]